MESAKIALVRNVLRQSTRKCKSGRLHTNGPIASLTAIPGRRYLSQSLPRKGPVNGLTVSQDRLWNTVNSTAEMAGGLANGGLHRLSCDDNDRKVRDWFAAEVKSIDPNVKYYVDRMGCQWAVFPGENNDIPPIGVGSHMDSVQNGGRFDGPLGVFTALEVAKVITAAKAQGKKMYAPLAVINWTNEEGARFPPGCMSSAVWSGSMDIETAHKCSDTTNDSITIGEELKRIGYAGDIEVSHKTNPLSAHFEVHIEQAKRLEESGAEVGIVTGGQGMRWYNASLEGFTRHTDTTPMNIRQDALVGAAKIVLEVQRLASESGTGMGTVSLFRSSPQNFCNIPGTVNFSFSLQHTDRKTLEQMEAGAYDFIRATAKQDNLELTLLEKIWNFEPFQFDQEAVQCVEDSAKDNGFKAQRIVNLTGHDSVYTNLVCPTAMVFIPCRDGISHNPAEYATPKDCSVGAQTILGAVLNYDGLLKEKYSK